MGVGKVVGGRATVLGEQSIRWVRAVKTLNESTTVMVPFLLIIVQTNLKNHHPIIYRYKCGGRQVVLVIGSGALDVRVTNMRWVRAVAMKIFVPQKTKTVHYLCLSIKTYLHNYLPTHYQYKRGGRRVGWTVWRLGGRRVLLQKCCGRRPDPSDGEWWVTALFFQ